MNWQTRKLGELCDIQLGKTPARSTASYWDEGRTTSNVWLSIADLLDAEDGFIFDSKEYLSDKGAELCKLVKKGTLLVSFKLTLGRLAFAGRDLYTNEAIAALTILDEAKLSRNYLLYFLHFFDWVKAAQNDVKLKGMTLNKAKLKVIPVSFPPLEEQKRLVAILDEAFAGIETATTNTEKNLANARELFDSYLNTTFLNYRKLYSEMTLEEVCLKTTKGSSPKWQGISYVEKPGVLFVTSENVGHYKMIFKKIKYVEEDFNKKDSKSILKNGDVLTNIVGASIGRTAVFDRDELANINQAVCLLRCNPDLLNNHYLCYLLNSPFFRRLLHENEVDNARANLSLTFFRFLKIPLPPIHDQSLLVESIGSLADEIYRLEDIYTQKLTALAELKHSLLQKAFSGELTAEAEKEVEEAAA
ncbi:restriction endonuclease subunit S [Desulfurivibrio dismutans]|uniref:restriction endonuclease subunit S n=1 Tax=Desulfurivibrio dismutans TaxID=1398908 RepID=UPI0023DBEA56|nr:restriction endonuclease subunit S [Desulfurivibrio alkaliphilus]MDF1615790.1 restriction endonuclease subunit S [Desulfurivibrio alkaliphilus]